MIKASGKLIMILLLFILLSLINIIIAMVIIHDIENDAELVNFTGIIRGEIQRICKLELLRQHNELLIFDIDKRLNQLTTKKYHVSFITKDETYFINKVINFKKHWEKLKKIIYNFRLNSDTTNRKELASFSESIWDESNNIVYLVENLSEKKVRHFNYLIFSIGLNFILLFIEIIIIKKIVQNKLEINANYDYLTKILNRASFDYILDKEIGIAKRYKSVFHLMMFDIDYFKKINDEYGHQIGDSVLQAISKLIYSNIRKIDSFARIGGEEFLLLDLETDINKVVSLGLKLKNIISSYKLKKIKKHVTVSIGITQFKSNDTKEKLLKRVDKALYKAKKNGRNRIEIIL